MDNKCCSGCAFEFFSKHGGECFHRKDVNRLYRKPVSVWKVSKNDNEDRKPAALLSCWFSEHYYIERREEDME